MDNYQSALIYLGGCSVLYLISKWLHLSYRAYPEENRDRPPASYYWLFSGIFRILSFPLSYLYSYLDRECEELARKDGAHKSSSFWLKEIDELQNKKWSRSGSLETKSLLFAQSVWFEISEFCKTHHYSESIEFKVHLFASFHFLLKDTLYHCASGSALNRNFKNLIYHYTDITPSNIDAIDRLVLLHNRLYDRFYEEKSNGVSRSHESILSAAILWGVPDDEFDEIIYDLSNKEAIDDFTGRINKLKAYAVALFTNNILE